MLPVQGSVTVAEYWVSNLGSDSNNGTSEETPWATLTKVAAGTYHNGDKIHFRRGDTFYGTLDVSCAESTGEKVLVDSYGTGRFPVISKYKIANPDRWELYSEGVYRIDLTDLGPNAGDTDLGDGAPSYIIGHLSIGGTIYGVRRTTVGGLSGEMEFYSDGSQYLYLRSSQAPAAPIFCASGLKAVNITSKKLVEYRNLEFVGAAHLLVSGSSAKDLHFHHCKFSAVGGGANSVGGVRLGNAFQLWCDCENILIENCVIADAYDAAITYQATATVAGANLLRWKNCIARNNIVLRCPYGFEWFAAITDDSGVNNTMGFFGCSYKRNLHLDLLGGWSASASVKTDIARAADLVFWDHPLVPVRYPANSQIDISENLFLDSSLPMLGNGNDLTIQGDGLHIWKNTKSKSVSVPLFLHSPTEKIDTVAEAEAAFPNFLDLTVCENVGGVDLSYGGSHLCGFDGWEEYA